MERHRHAAPSVRDRRRELHRKVRAGRSIRRSSPGPTRSSGSARSVRSGPRSTLAERDRRAFEAGACDEDIVATLISIATIIGHARAASAAPRSAASDTTSTTPSKLTGRRTSSESDEGVSNRARKTSSAQDDNCTAQADHALRGSVRRGGGALAANTDASEQHDGIDPRRSYRTATADRRRLAAEPAARRRSKAFARPGFWHRDPFARRAPARARPASLRIVRACVQYAASVQYQGVTLSDLSAVAGVSERRVRDAFNDCHGMSPTAYFRVAALREVRRTLLDGPFARDPVTRAASEFGFWHLSRFAGQYRALFGESPSETVARGRACAESG